MFIELNKFLTVFDWFKSSKIYFALIFLEVITWKFTKLVYMLLVTPGLFTTLPILERVLGIKPFLKLFASNWKKELDTCKGWICASFTKKYMFEFCCFVCCYSFRLIISLMEGSLLPAVKAWTAFEIHPIGLSCEGSLLKFYLGTSDY